MLKKPSFWLCLFVSCLLNAQEEKNFSIRYQNYLKGDIYFIANSIIGKKSGKNANEPYDKISSNAKLNDQLNMAYIDIDQELETFSSSSAVLEPIHPNDKVLFAGLYWCATLPDRNNSIQPINKISIKTPQSENYFTIEGSILYDAKEHNKHTTNAPYVCFSDITDQIKSKPWGTYTVANIQASQEKIEGGSAAGWVLYVIYESDSEPYHLISLYDGFSYIYNKPVEINFKEFITPKTGKITPKLTVAALEGDLNIEGDNLRINTPNTKKWYYISNSLRSGQNIFNSKITHYNTDFNKRTPASLNTLGYDVFLDKIQTKELSFSDIDQVNLKISSLGDKFYVTNIGFSIEIDEDFARKKIDSTLSTKYSITQKNVQIPKQKKNLNPIDTNTIRKTIVEPTSTKNSRKPKEIKTYLFDSTVAPEGYYIIANAYQNIHYAHDFANKISSKTIQPFIFKNPDNQLYYLSLKHYKSQTAAEKAYYNNINNTYFQEYWIAKIQHPNTPLETSYKNKTRIEKEISTIKINKSNTTLKQGYYLVSNVFEIPTNTTKYVTFLKKQGFTASFFINPINNYYYTYLEYYTDLEKIKADYFSNYNNRFFDEYWIMEVILE
ncbi:SPOR domain-containing protein [Flavobacterium columnare]|uniref:Adhesin SprB n=2 Tax=Flavobacterium columnare TaxID=996 RepID=G8X934_FLACA|nr:SPOR domain-containing protein [Flavobacterium columnare]AEW85085.1 adhesin SprB [Flavobacterium columnare ATCC 49512]MBF6654561.1 SPOR domain-containing protein [Flavobacterium columnare]MBF6658003.1 SPOR domain-containing protein [Flavobacterium columnare]QOG90958.1 SPOR domain-containing protein [Flavobacterium columnare]QOG93612.1 SPOR domain-containing protein [Flavobacterium columnare]